MPIDPNKVTWDAPDPKAVKWDTPASEMAPTSRTPARTLDVIASAPYEGLASAADLIYGTPQNIYNLVAAGYGTAATALGRPDLAPEVQAPPTPVANFLRQRGLIRDTSGMTPGQTALSSGIQSATLAALSPAQSAKQAVLNAITGLTGGATAESVSQATGSPVAGIAAGSVVPAAIARRQQVLAQKQVAQQQNAVRDATLRAAQGEGYVIPPGNVRPTAVNRALETIAGKTELQQIASAKNQRVTDSLARRAVGLDETAELTPETMKAVRSAAFERGYKPIENVGKVPVDNDYLNSMAAIEARYTGAAGSFPQAVPDTVRKIINQNLVPQFEAKDAIKRIQSLRDEATAAFRRGDNDIARANRAVAEALEDQIERHISQSGGKSAQQMLADFRDARKRMAISHTVENAIRVGTGSVDAKKLAAQLSKGRPLTGELRTAAQFASAFPNVNAAVPGTMGTPGVTNPMFLPGGAGLAIGSLLGGPVVGGTTAAAAAAARPLAQRGLLSSFAQRNALSRAAAPTQTMNPYLYNALIGIPVVE